jgi:Domain of unknown function (DUF4260)
VHVAHPHTPRRTWRRPAFIALTALLLAAAVAVILEHGSGWWLLLAFGLGPDLALLLGAGTGLEKGQLHRRAVPLYNALHSYWGPALLALACILLPAGAFVAPLAWAFHISLDRSVGYGMRTRDGFQRA